MSARDGVDVIRVLDRAISKVERVNAKVVYRGITEGFAEETTDDGLREARAAIAELIAADREYDEAHAAYAAAPTGKPRNAVWRRVLVAHDRRAAALANVGASA